jgi:hypothetical protein
MARRWPFADPTKRNEINYDPSGGENGPILKYQNVFIKIKHIWCFERGQIIL